MNAKSTIRKILFVTVWLCIGGGMFTLLLAAISKRNKGLCKDYSIVIKGSLNNYFLDRNDVEQQLKKATKGSIKGQPLSSLNLYELENMLENNTWVNDAELYIDNQEVLHISVTEKEPVARIFNTTGNSFYIDKSGMKMPLSEKLSARVPVFTGFPTKKNFAAVDSLLLKKVTVMANYIVNDSFWLAQVAQIDITPERTFEMIPVVGNHIVRMGEGDNVERQLHRLMVFYKQVLSKTGFDKYKVIDVRYAGQVVASRYAGNAKVDSIQLKKNVEKLLQQSRDAVNADGNYTRLKDQPVLNNDWLKKEYNQSPIILITADKATVYEDENCIYAKKQYFVKGDKLLSIAETEKTVYVEYIPSPGKFVYGWIKKTMIKETSSE